MTAGAPKCRSSIPPRRGRRTAAPSRFQVGVDSPLNPRHPARVAAQRFAELSARERSGARLLAVTLFAPAALGLVMTLTLLPIFIGLPLLLLFGRPWWVSLRVARGRASFGRAARVHLLVAATAWTLGWFGSAIVGFDDLDSTDTALWALVVLPYSTVMWVGTVWIAAASREPRSETVIVR